MSTKKMKIKKKRKKERNEKKNEQDEREAGGRKEKRGVFLVVDDRKYLLEAVVPILQF